MGGIEACPRTGCLLGPEHHLRAAEYGDTGVAALDADHRIPDLRRAAKMQRFRTADDGPFARGAEEVRLQLDGGETLRAFRQRRPAAITAARVRQRDDRCRVQVAV